LLLDDAIQRLQELRLADAVTVEDILLRTIVRYTIETLQGIQTDFVRFMGVTLDYNTFYERTYKASAFYGGAISNGKSFYERADDVDVFLERTLSVVKAGL
jgi:hypothetical protein